MGPVTLPDAADRSAPPNPYSAYSQGSVARLQMGWSYAFGPAPLFDPPCFEEVEDQQECCNRRPGPGFGVRFNH